MAYANTIHAGMGKHRGLSVDAADVPLQRLVLSVDAGGAAPAPMSACAGCGPKAMYDAIAEHRRHASLRRADRHVGADQRDSPRTSGDFRRP